MVQTLLLVSLVVGLNGFLVIEFLESGYFTPHLGSLHLDSFDFMFNHTLVLS